jgi:hypothetical protein
VLLVARIGWSGNEFVQIIKETAGCTVLDNLCGHSCGLRFYANRDVCVYYQSILRLNYSEEMNVKRAWLYCNWNDKWEHRKMCENVDITLLQLSWDDILFQHVLPLLTLKDCFSLRSTSKLCRELVDSYLTRIKDVNVALFKTFNGPAFQVRRNRCSALVVHTDTTIAWVFKERCLKTSCALNQTFLFNLQVLVENCWNIRRLNVAYCNWLEDKLLKPLLCNNKYLSYVNLSGCLGLTSACLHPLIVSCKVSSFTTIIMKLWGSFRICIYKLCLQITTLLKSISC